MLLPKLLNINILPHPQFKVVQLLGTKRKESVIHIDKDQSCLGDKEVEDSIVSVDVTDV